MALNQGSNRAVQFEMQNAHLHYILALFFFQYTRKNISLIKWQHRTHVGVPGHPIKTDKSLTFLVVEVGRQSLCNSTDPGVIRLRPNFHSI